MIFFFSYPRVSPRIPARNCYAHRCRSVGRNVTVFYSRNILDPCFNPDLCALGTIYFYICHHKFKKSVVLRCKHGLLQAFKTKCDWQSPRECTYSRTPIVYGFIIALFVTCVCARINVTICGKTMC
jgi:hypothetical protein